MDSLAFIEQAERAKRQPVYVLHGDEDFLKRQVQRVLRTILLGPDPSEFALSTYAGDEVSFATVHDELHTIPFLSSCRLVMIERADPFVTEHRSALEKYVGQPSQVGVLVLDVKTWPANTRLAKLIPQSATIICKAIASYKLPEWCMRWAASQHGCTLERDAAQLLVDLIGPEMGMLDQELAKLAVYVGKSRKIRLPDVDQLVGRSREENVFQILDAIAGGQPQTALLILDRLLEQGEEPLRILAALSVQLRRLVQAARLMQQRVPLQSALDEAGIPSFARRGAEAQLRHLGNRRLSLIYPWLLEVDLGLKGSSPLPPRTLLERLIVRLSSKQSTSSPLVQR